MNEHIDESPASVQDGVEQTVIDVIEAAAADAACAAETGAEAVAEAAGCAEIDKGAIVSELSAAAVAEGCVKAESSMDTVDENAVGLCETVQESDENEATEEGENAESAEGEEENENEATVTADNVPTENAEEVSDSKNSGTEAEVDAVVSKISSLLFSPAQPEKTTDEETEKAEEEVPASEKAPETEDSALWRNILPERMEALRAEEYARRQRRRDMGLCQYCGGAVEKQLLDWRCSVCGMKKDYK